MKNCDEHLSLKLVQGTMQMLAGKWKLQIVTFLMNNSKPRFMEIQRGVAGISSRVLSAELQHLEQNGIINRMVSDPKLTVVEYQLTDKGHALQSLLITLSQWGAKYILRQSR
jgi:DNA-binding HxlR family transcriptional regulator